MDDCPCLYGLLERGVTVALTPRPHSSTSSYAAFVVGQSLHFASLWRADNRNALAQHSPANTGLRLYSPRRSGRLHWAALQVVVMQEFGLAS